MGEVILGQLLSSTSALFVAPRTPIFPGFSRMVARLFANPRGPVGFQELKNTSFFQAFLVTRDYKMGRSRAENKDCKWIYRFRANPGRPWGGIVPSSPVLAPGPALGSRSRVALSSSQAPLM